MRTKTYRHTGICVRWILAALAMAPIAGAAEDRVVLYHELDGAGNIIRSVALGGDIFELISVVTAILVFWTVIRFVMSD